MKATRIDHVAVAVKDLDAAIATYQHNFDLQKVGGGAAPSLGIHNAFLQIGGSRIELITPASTTGPVAEFLEQSGEGMYLLSLQVEDWTRPCRISKIWVHELELPQARRGNAWPSSARNQPMACCCSCSNGAAGRMPEMSDLRRR